MKTFKAPERRARLIFYQVYDSDAKPVKDLYEYDGCFYYYENQEFVLLADDYARALTMWSRRQPDDFS